MGVSTTFASAALGVGRDDHPETLPTAGSRIIERARATFNAEQSLWSQWLEKEAHALFTNDGHALIHVGSQIPQRWRRDNQDLALKSFFCAVDRAANTGTPMLRGLAASTYAGTYFGIQQALDLDALRTGIDEVLPPGDKQTRWPRACMITALAHAASSATFSSGKHFAQPHRVHDGKNLEFHAARALTDRSVNLVAKFAAAIDQLNVVARPACEHHRTYQARVEDVSAEDLMSWGVDTVYADPPYTAQQYSRFYHVLETLANGIPAKLQLRGGAVTRGLYPENRYLSPFCSRVQAADAIGDLAHKSAKAGANLVFSYSDSVSSSTGNARSVALDTVVNQLEQAYGCEAVSVQQLSFRYRQFNRAAAVVRRREDPEFLVVARIGGSDAS